MRARLFLCFGLSTAFAVAGACCSSSSPNETSANDASANDAGIFDASSIDALSFNSDAACPNLPDATLVDPTTTPTFAIVGEPGSAFGIYDPSLVYPKGAPGGVLSYSTVSNNDVHTRVAVSTDLGATFQYAAEPNQTTPVSITTTDPSVCDAASCMVNGVLWHEVSSIIADPTDPNPNGAFKLFVHSYASLDSGNNLRRDWGYIGMYAASAPNTWGAEKKLLGWSSNATISSNGAAQLLTDLPALHDCIAFTEPGAIVGPQGIDLALSCAYAASPTDIRIRVVLLRSVDHANTFSFVSTLLAAEDFGCIDGTVPQILGPDLFSVGAQEYVVVSPVGPVSNASSGGYRACVTIPIADVDAGTVARSSNGAPTVASWVSALDERFTGPCTYAEGATAIGLLVPMQFTDQSQPFFRILRTTIAEP